MKSYQIYIGTDHRGFELKNELAKLLKSKGYEVVDVGPEKHDPKDDYTDYALKVGRKVVDGGREAQKTEKIEKKGILICGSGIGVNQAVSKIPGIRASKVHSKEEAKLDMQEHDSNVLTLSADQGLSPEEYLEIIEAWLTADFLGGRHLRRINKMKFQDALNKYVASDPLVVPTIFLDDEDKFKAQFEELAKSMPIVNADTVDNVLVQGNTISPERTVELLKKMDEKHNHLSSFHMMVQDPGKYFQDLNNLPNLLIVYVHAEADIEGLVDQEWSFQLGLTLNPDTKIENVDYKSYPVIQLMTVQPGAQGRGFEVQVLKKAKKLRDLGYKGEIHLDGSVNLETLPEILKYDVDVVNVGSAIVKQPDYREAYMKLVNFIDSNR